jgi:hypothetical protein
MKLVCHHLPNLISVLALAREIVVAHLVYED